MRTEKIHDSIKVKQKAEAKLERVVAAAFHQFFPWIWNILDKIFMYYHNSNRPFVEKGTLVIFPKRKKKRKEVPSRHNRDTKNMLIFRMAKPVLYRIVVWKVSLPG